MAVLTAIAIPVFTSQLEKSREATDMSNIRAAYAETMAAYLANGANSGFTASVSAKQQQTGWQNTDFGKLYARIDGAEIPIEFSAKTVGASWIVSVGSAGTGSTAVSVG